MTKRSDLVIAESVFQGEKSWVVKDPVGLKYFQLKPPEYLVFTLLDGSATYTDLRRVVSKRFPELRPTKEDIQNLIVSFHQSGLLLIEAAEQAAPLRKQRSKEFRQKLIGLMSSLVSIKFPGVDPDRFLSWVYPKTRLLFSRTFTCFVLFLSVAAVVLVLSNFAEFFARLPQFEQFFGVKNLVYMGIVLIFTKTIHELGHGLVCKHFGGECHEIGFMLLVFTPAMYCNTSDSWILPNKWHRIAIGAGGMYFEIFMASVFTFVWWYTNPNWLHYLALNIMFLSSVSTLLFNLNPLLRYDGYYMLSDFLEIPNLSQKSKSSLINKLRVWCLGMNPVNSRMLPTRHQSLFAIYSVASFVYRWFVLVFIFYFISEVLEPYGLAIVGHLMIIISLVGMIVVPFVKLMKFFLFPGRLREVKSKKLIGSSLIVVVAVSLFCFLPVGHEVQGSFVLLPNDAQHVFVQQPGRIVEIRVFPGEQVKKGDVIAILGNSEVLTAIRQLESELSKLESTLDAYRLRRSSTPEVENLIGQLVVEIGKTKRQIEIRRTQERQLTLVADRGGTVILPPNIPQVSTSKGQLGAFSGSPFDRENQDAFLLPQTLFCYVGDPQNLKGIVAIEERNAALLSEGQPVTLLFRQSRDRRVLGVIEEVASREIEVLPRELSKTNGGYIPGEPQRDGTERPLVNMFEAVVAIENMPTEALPGFFGRARIRVGKASLGWRTYRYVLSLTNFR